MAKKAVKKEKPPRVDNPEAVQRYQAELNRGLVGPPTGEGLRKRSATLEKLFLEGLAQGHSVTTSAWTIGIHRGTMYDWRAASEASLNKEDGSYRDDFCVRWDDAVEAGNDRLEDEARRRAVNGYERPVYQGGVMVGTTTEYSDNLLTSLMKGNRPSKFNTERHELTGADRKPIAHSMEIEFVDAPKVKK